jgi:hypothetical protein
MLRTSTKAAAVRVVSSYNVLSSHLARPNHYTTYNPAHLEASNHLPPSSSSSKRRWRWEDLSQSSISTCLPPDPSSLLQRHVRANCGACDLKSSLLQSALHQNQIRRRVFTAIIFFIIARLVSSRCDEIIQDQTKLSQRSYDSLPIVTPEPAGRNGRNESTMVRCVSGDALVVPRSFVSNRDRSGREREDETKTKPTLQQINCASLD